MLLTCSLVPAKFKILFGVLGSFEFIVNAVAMFVGKVLNSPGLKVTPIVQLSPAGNAVDKSAAKRGKAVFTNAGGCVACHGNDAKGNSAFGAANLTDKIWTIADVTGAETAEAKKAAVMSVVKNGKTRQMPAWKDRLSATEIKMLTFYVKQLSASK